MHYTTIGSKAFLNVVGTNRGSEELQHFYGIDPSRLLVNPFPCPPTVSVSDQAGGELLQRLSLCSGQFLLYPAQFWPHKNHLAALMALRLLIDCGRALKIVFTGSDKGSLKAVEEYVDQLGLKSSVVNAGFVDRHDLAALYSHCFALLYPSFFGPDNIPPLEAMSYRTPALVADVPGAFEQYGDAVLRFNPGEPAQIVDCVNRLYDEPGLRECLIESGLKLISSLTPASYVDRVENFLAAESLPLLCSALM